GFDWDLGDGTLGGGMTVTHAYTQAGAYTVHLLASNACGWAAMSHTLSVVEPCTPVEIVTVTYSAESCQVSLSAELTGTAPFTWLWDMGTLGTSTETHPLFDLGQTGTYTGTLEAWNCGEDGYAVHTFSVDVFCTTEYKIYLPLLFKGAEN
ncbi:MAG: PKD domain-containing protein, partial [Chloroflexia bacterium]|nr:PKD domain-containing protein [Chloroflexia bacterium]